MDRNTYYGGESASLNLNQVRLRVLGFHTGSSMMDSPTLQTRKDPI
jgi:RAB protein geranylgeranyltransferase component A